MAENITVPTGASVEEFLSNIDHPTRREDGFALLRIMSDATGQPAVMWGPSIVGFGSYHYRGASREGDFAAVGYSPRKANLALYGVIYRSDTSLLLPKLGKHKLGVGCLYINKLDDVDTAVLEQLVREGYEYVMTELDVPRS
ncbi:DUF1801 domain-containing protein [Arthrobacter sp. CDRTa11]|uniref:DUF1801 domain-containing protein n=1 Tax=Arthrobacter sp. CDRTa11 TaxID=2651199 RepID=UPI002265AE09|nr:DUF1801 domain-containing protein [Arthrobacter sp. CDRTa11]UZX03300.1 DUF1801 domain-containing protein [Arthrobacter sp. CDRTa11]